MIKSRERASWLRGRAAGGAHLAGSKAGTLKVRASPAVEGPAQLIWAEDAMLTYDRMSLVLTGLIRIVLSNKSASEMKRVQRYSIPNWICGCENMGWNKGVGSGKDQIR